MTAVYSGDATYQGSIGPPLTANGSSATSNGSYMTSSADRHGLWKHMPQLLADVVHDHLLGPRRRRHPQRHD